MHFARISGPKTQRQRRRKEQWGGGKGGREKDKEGERETGKETAGKAQRGKHIYVEWGKHIASTYLMVLEFILH